MNGRLHIINNFQQKIANAEEAGLVQNKVQKRRTLPSVPAAEVPICGKAVSISYWIVLLAAILSVRFMSTHAWPTTTHAAGQHSQIHQWLKVFKAWKIKIGRPKGDQDKQLEKGNIVSIWKKPLHSQVSAAEYFQVKKDKWLCHFTRPQHSLKRGKRWWWHRKWIAPVIEGQAPRCLWMLTGDDWHCCGKDSSDLKDF